MRKNKDCELAYVAGFFDGEGSIYLCHGSNYFLCATLTNTRYDVLKQISERFGGQISKSPNPDKKYTRKQLYRLRWYSNQAKSFLELIWPYLIIKRDKAILAIEFQSRMVNGKLTIPKEEQEVYKSRIKEA